MVVLRVKAGIWSPTAMSSKKMDKAKLLIMNEGHDAGLHPFAALVRPFGLVIGVARQAVAALPLLPMGQAGTAGDAVALAHARPEPVDLAAVPGLVHPLHFLAGARGRKPPFLLGQFPGPTPEIRRTSGRDREAQEESST